MDFEWDPVKSGANFRKHGVGFGEAVTAFDDPWALTAADERHSSPGEAREWLIGESDGGRVLVIVFTMRQGGKIRRLISARPANRRERGRYAALKGISI